MNGLCRAGVTEVDMGLRRGMGLVWGQRTMADPNDEHATGSEQGKTGKEGGGVETISDFIDLRNKKEINLKLLKSRIVSTPPPCLVVLAKKWRVKARSSRTWR